MDRLSKFLRSHMFTVGTIAVLVPLFVLLALQYNWLVRLAQTTALAHDGVRRSYADAVGAQIESTYRTMAGRVLSVPPTVFTRDDPQQLSRRWQDMELPGVRSLFVVDYTRVASGNLYLFDRASGQLFSPPASEETLAIIIACLPWQTRSLAQGTAESVGIQVDERDPEHRILLYPVIGGQANVVAVTGMILDADYFRQDLVRSAVQGPMSTFFPARQPGDLMVVVRDGNRYVVLGEVPPGSTEPALSSRFPFVFADWRLELYERGAAAQDWARTGFLFNVILGLLVAVALIGGVLLALRAANKAVRLSEMKSDFVSNVSHELRTPLASIRAFAELLHHGKVNAPEKVREYGERIELESRRLSRLVDNILDFSRIESRRKVYTFAPTDIAELVEAVTQSFEARLEQAGFRFNLLLPSKPLAPIKVDADAISRAVHNLIDNAVKYSEERKAIGVQVRTEVDGVVIAVQDAGIGIAQANQGRIFTRFHRVGTGLVHNVRGSGQGLAIVEHIARAHGGRVDIESELGEGSTFSLHIPWRRQAADPGIPN